MKKRRAWQEWQDAMYATCLAQAHQDAKYQAFLAATKAPCNANQPTLNDEQ